MSQNSEKRLGKKRGVNLRKRRVGLPLPSGRRIPGKHITELFLAQLLGIEGKET